MKAPARPSGTLREFLALFPCCRWLNQPGSLHLDVELFNHTCCPHSPSIPAPVAAAQNGNGSLHLAQFGLLKALLRDASICLFSPQMLMPVDCICPNNPCDTGDRALLCEEQSLMTSVHGNVWREMSIPWCMKQNESDAYIPVLRCLLNHFCSNKNTTQK